jgi:hypothetical protein
VGSRSLAFKVILITLGALVVAAAIALAVLWFWVRPAIKARVVEGARERGIELVFTELEVWPGEVRIGGAQFRLIGVSGFGGRARSIRILLRGTEPDRILLETPEIILSGSLPRLSYELAAWTRRYPDAYALPLSAEGTALTWQADATQPPVLVLRDGSLRRDGDKTTFSAPAATLAGTELGSVEAAWARDQGVVELGFGEAEPAKAPLIITVNDAASSATITLEPLPSEQLEKLLGIELGLSGARVGAKSSLVWAPSKGDASSEITKASGDLSVTLHGYVPPHPRELDGFVFGDQTVFTTRFELDPSARRVSLTDSQVRAGAFRLAGDGYAELLDRAVRVRLDLTGHLSCAALAGAAAESHLGRELGRLAGRLARKALEGSVAVMVKIEALSNDIPNARVLRTIGVGCGLKPLVIPNFSEWLEKMPNLGAGAGGAGGARLPALPSGFPALPSGLPALPSAFSLPPLPPLPGAPAKPQGVLPDAGAAKPESPAPSSSAP